MSKVGPKNICVKAHMQIRIYWVKRNLKQSLHSALLTTDASKKLEEKIKWTQNKI